MTTMTTQVTTTTEEQAFEGVLKIVLSDLELTKDACGSKLLESQAIKLSDSLNREREKYKR